jgi:tetratricopeptide (TPR) repeat protein
VRSKGLIFLALLGSVPCLRAANPAPIDCTHLLAWTAGGVPSRKLSSLIQAEGIGFVPSEKVLHEFHVAGAGPELLESLKGARHKGATACPSSLVEATRLARSNDLEDASDLLDSLVDDDPRNDALHFFWGYVKQRQGDWNGAFDEYSGSKDANPTFSETHNRLALFFYQAEDGDSAIAEARTALSMDFDDPDAYRMLGLGHYANGQYAAARNAFDESLARDPNNAQVYYEMGLAARDQGSDVAAISLFRRAIVLKPRLWPAHLSLGALLGKEHRFNEALTELITAKQLASHEPSVREQLALMYHEEGQYDRAIAEYAELFRLYPNWKHGHDSLARSYMAKNEYGQAIAELKLAVEQNPTNAGQHRALGQLMLAAGQKPDAVRELRIATELEPDSASSHYFLGTALLESQQFPAALKEFQDAVRLNPSAEYHYALAACLMNLGRDREALAELETAARLDPSKELYNARKEELLRLMKSGNVQPR